MAERATYGQWSFNGGEVSPRVQARTDQAIYSISTEEMLGWLPLLQGPALAAPGTIYVEKAAGQCRLFPFEYNSTEGYVVEASNGKFRFYTNDARINTGGGAAYSVNHSYSYADLLALDYLQSADVLYLAGADQQQKKLSRLTATTFAFDDFDLRGGPMEIGNADETLTMIASAATGAITITASAAVFKATDVGRLLELEATDFHDIRSWQAGMDNLTVGTKLTWGGRVYQIAALSDYLGTNPPEHDSGSEWDGDGIGVDTAGHGPFGALLTYLYNRFGMVKITGYTSATQVSAQVIDRLADSLTTQSTWRWTLGAFSDTTGWPDTVGLWNDRLTFTLGNRVFVSVVGDFDNFKRRDGSGDFQRDLAGSFTLPTPHKVVWQASDRQLLLGTETGEYTVDEVQIQTGTPGPPVFEIRQQSTNGSKRTKPVQADGRMLFVQRAGRKLREMGYAISADRYLAPDMTRLADHIGAQGFVELAWQAEPERLVWAVREDGTLAAMTYDPQQQVMGWCRRELGGGLLAQSACRITDPDGKRDQIWISAKSGGNYWVLRMAKAWELGDDQKDAFFVDAGLSYNGAAATVFAGLNHLNGMTVDILADGKPHRQLLVAGNQVTLDYAASNVHIGLPFPAWFTTLPPEAGQSEGVARGKKKAVRQVDIYMVETQGIRISVQGCDAIPVETRTDEDPMDQAVPLFTGLYSIDTIGTYEELGKIKIERYQPTPGCITAIVPAIEVGER